MDKSLSIYPYGGKITFDGKGHSVSFSTPFPYEAVDVNWGNVVVKNLTISNSYYGIMLDNVNGCTLFNNTVTGCTIGVLVWGSNNSTIYNNTIMDNLTWGAFVDGGSNNTFYNNNFINNPIQAGVETGSNNSFYRDGPDGRGGNYWSNWCPPAHPDTDNDGFVDVPYTDNYWKVVDNLPWAKQNGWLNKPPSCEIDPAGPLSVYAGAAATFTVIATDPDEGDEVTLTSGQLPSGATMDPLLPCTGSSPLTSVFTWTPTPAQRGMHTISFTATDRAGEHADCSIVIEVLNNPPVTTDAKPSIAEIWPPNNKMVSVAIEGVTDPDGDPVTITIMSITDNEGSHADHADGIGTSTAQLLPSAKEKAPAESTRFPSMRPMTRVLSLREV